MTDKEILILVDKDSSNDEHWDEDMESWVS